MKKGLRPLTAFRRARRLRTASPSREKALDPIDPRWLSLLPPQDEQPAVAETPPLVGALLRLIPIAYGRYPPSIVRSDRLANGPLTGVRRKRHAFVFSTNRPAGRMPMVAEDGTRHPEPVRRTALAFAEASD